MPLDTVLKGREDAPRQLPSRSIARLLAVQAGVKILLLSTRHLRLPRLLHQPVQVPVLREIALQSRRKGQRVGRLSPKARLLHRDARERELPIVPHPEVRLEAPLGPNAPARSIVPQVIAIKKEHHLIGLKSRSFLFKKQQRLVGSITSHPEVSHLHRVPLSPETGFKLAADRGLYRDAPPLDKRVAEQGHTTDARSLCLRELAVAQPNAIDPHFHVKFRRDQATDAVRDVAPPQFGIVVPDRGPAKELRVQEAQRQLTQRDADN